MRLHRVSISLAAQALLLDAVVLSAEPERFRVLYDAPEQCPTPETFTAQLEQRSARARPATGPMLARIVRVRIREETSEFSGTLQLVDAKGDATERTVTAPDCVALVEALSLAGALALDSLAAEAPKHVEQPWLVPRLCLPFSRAASGGAWSAMVLHDAPERRPAQPERPAWLGSLAVTLGNGWSPEWAPGLAAAVEHDWDTGLSLEGGLVGASAGRVRVADDSANFEWVAAMAQACTWLDAGAGTRLAGCALPELGVIRGKGRRGDTIVTTRVQWRTWLAFGPALRLTYWLGSSERVDALVGLPVPLLRPEFVFEAPRVTVHRVPDITVYSAIGLAVGLP